MAKRRRQTRIPGGTGRRAAERRDASGISTRTVAIAGIAVVVLAAAAIIAFAGAAPAASFSCDEQLTAPAGTTTGTAFTTENLGRTHVSPGTKIRYAFCPPTSGNHYNAAGVGPLRPGFYGPSDAAGPGGWVHNLEHGYAVLLYRCDDDGCPSDTDVTALRQFANNGPPSHTATACGYRSKLVVARFDQMASPYALLAWDRAVFMDSFDASGVRDLAAELIEATGPEPKAC